MNGIDIGYIQHKQVGVAIVITQFICKRALNVILHFRSLGFGGNFHSSVSSFVVGNNGRTSNSISMTTPNIEILCWL